MSFPPSQVISVPSVASLGTLPTVNAGPGALFTGLPSGQTALIGATGEIFSLEVSSLTVDGITVLATMDDPTRQWILSAGGTGFGVQTVPNFAALAALPAAGFSEGTIAYVQSARAQFVKKASTAATRTNFRVACNGASGFQWVRQLSRDGYWEVQATWNVDPTNSTGTASDDNSGADGTHCLLTHQEASFRLYFACHAQVTTYNVFPGLQQVGDNPVWTNVPIGQGEFTVVGIPAVLFTSTVTGYTAAAYGTTAADDNEFVDSAVPGGSFTAAGLVAPGTLIQRQNGTKITAQVLRDLGSTTARLNQPCNPASPFSNVSFVIGDTYEGLTLPTLISWAYGVVASTNLCTNMNLMTWNVPASTFPSIPSINFTSCCILKPLRPSAQTINLAGCILDTTALSFEGASASGTFWGIQQTAFRGSGSTLHGISGVINSETAVVSLEACTLILENGTWNGGQFNLYDTATGLQSGTGGRIHLLSSGTINGKNNTGKLVKATAGSQILSANPITAGTFYTAASTSDGNPIATAATSSTTAIPLDGNMNGVFQTF